MQRLEFAERLTSKLNRAETNVFRIYSSPHYINHYAFPATFDIADAYRQEIGDFCDIERQAIADFSEELRVIEEELAGLLKMSENEDDFYAKLDDIMQGYGLDMKIEGRKSTFGAEKINLNIIAKHIWTAFAVPVRIYGPYAVRIHAPIHLSNVPQISVTLANYVLAENFLLISQLLGWQKKQKRLLSIIGSILTVLSLLLALILYLR